MPTDPSQAIPAADASQQLDDRSRPGELLAQLRRSVAAAADDWVRDSVAAKGWTGLPHADAEEWASGPLPVARFLAHLHSLHREPERRRSPARIPGLGDALLLAGYRVHLHTSAVATKHSPGRGGTALVLGAGNVTATPVLDVLDQVFVHGRAVLLKASPLHAPVLPVLARALAPLHDAGLLRVIAGDAAIGASLARRPDVGAVHVTGSAATWNTLRNDAALRGKTLTGEVGCCTPALVLPGAWREPELRHVAAQLAAFVAANGGAHCLAPRVLLTAAAWPQREALRQHVAAAMAALPPRVPFHPGVRAHFAIAARNERAPDALPPTLTTPRDAAAEAELCDRELFAPVLREAALPGDDIASFGAHAAVFVHEHCFGSLSAYVFAAPALRARHRAAVDTIVAALPHGTVAINTWTGVGYGLGTTPWGVPPGAPVEHGSGFSRDTSPDGAAQRVVVEAPFRPLPLPPWLPSHRRAAATLRSLTLQALRPSLPRLLAAATHALASP